jgi:hypothetical protein
MMTHADVNDKVTGSMKTSPVEVCIDALIHAGHQAEQS